MSNMMPQPLAHTVVDHWDADHAGSLSALGRLAYRSNLLGADRAVANFGGGNTSTKVTEPDHLGRPILTLYVKGSGSDLATITPAGFAGFRQEELLPLMNRDELDDAAMVAYLGRCQIDPAMPRGSIETLLHSFIPAPCVDHTHPDAINMICCAVDGERLARECFGDAAIWVPYIRPGFTLARQVGEAVRTRPTATMVLLDRHGLVTWGETDAEAHHRTIDAINTAAAFVNARAAGQAPFGGVIREPLPTPDRLALLAAILPTLRGHLSRPIEGADARHDDGRRVTLPKILSTDMSPATLAFAAGHSSATLSQVGAACPDHLVHTKARPLWVPFDPEQDDTDALLTRIGDGVGRYRAEYADFHRRHED